MDNRTNAGNESGGFRIAGFSVIDKTTGTIPDCCEIALREEWANNLIYCDIDGFAFTENGTLVLTDDCGNVAFCPSDRFEVIWDIEKIGDDGGDGDGKD